MHRKKLRILAPSITDLKYFPPSATFLNYLSAQDNTEVVVLSYHSNESSFSESVKVRNISKTPYPSIFIDRLIAKVRSYYHFYKYLLKNKREVDIIFIGIWDFNFLKQIVKLINFKGIIVYQFHELDLSKLHLCRDADFCLIPEENRLWLTYFLGNLGKLPLLLPNIPNTQLGEAAVVPEIINELKRDNKKILLYQGLVSFKRRCLAEIIESLTLSSNELHLIIMPGAKADPAELGKVNTLALQLGVSERVHIIASLPAPMHLEIIRYADIGIGLYRPTSLNQVYAAPNRLYEFSKFGIPQILPDFPMFKALSVKFPFAVNVVNPESADEIATALNNLLIEVNYSNGVDMSNRFFLQNGDYSNLANKVWNEILKGII
ncbi:glycosyltransferase family 4 protein [Neolewinella litorea]|uniref:Glycosyltransferase n=1 Tax=Neolewinella litorea TaxID=2562452 RepID=A0A4S4NET2_9BACT|nr:glycosyltransferase family 4 protein [Neolewinella litorea]THH34570.1 hypothetical protein E4021_17560 [Neolewinella litorea]